VVQECVVDRDRVGGIGEGGESGALSGGDQLFGRPDVVRGGFREEIRPVGTFGSFDGFKVAKLSLPCCGVGVGGPQVFSFAGGFRKLFSEGGEQRGPPGFGHWGGA